MRWRGASVSMGNPVGTGTAGRDMRQTANALFALRWLLNGSECAKNSPGKFMKHLLFILAATVALIGPAAPQSCPIPGAASAVAPPLGVLTVPFSGVLGPPID